MTLGERLKQLRQQQSLSQPELADLAGIEQSYLSKIENDKSLPSNDILRKLLLAFKVPLNELLTEQLITQDLVRLKQIPDIENHLNQQQLNTFITRRRYLTLSSLLIVIAITLFYSGYSKLIFNETIYPYESEGVVFESEPLDIFHDWQDYLEAPHLHASDKVAFKKSMKAIEAKRLEIAKRRDVKTINSSDYLGREFVQEVEGGKRSYFLSHNNGKQMARSINAWLQLIGVFLFVSGVMGFVLERKLFK